MKDTEVVERLRAELAAIVPHPCAVRVDTFDNSVLVFIHVRDRAEPLMEKAPVDALQTGSSIREWAQIIRGSVGASYDRRTRFLGERQYLRG